MMSLQLNFVSSPQWELQIMNKLYEMAPHIQWQIKELKYVRNLIYYNEIVAFRWLISILKVPNVRYLGYN